MKTYKLTMAQALVKFLNNQYVQLDDDIQPFIKGIFTLFGHGNVLGIGQALEEDKGHLQIFQGKNEQGMTLAAIAFAKQMNRKQIFACTTSVGPGAANMVTAAGTATANNIPVLLLPGDVYASRQPDPVLQQLEQTNNLSISTNDAFKPVTKYWDRVTRPEQLMSAMISAMRVLTNPADTGAVAICLPQDVEAESYDYPESFFAKRIHRIDRTIPTKYMIQDGIKAITQAKKPFVVVGGGVRYSECGKAVMEFCEKFNIPFGETQAGKGTIPYDFSYNLGGVGVTGGYAANYIARQSDLIIGLGTRFTDFTSGSKELFPENANHLNINISNFHATKLDAVKIVADCKESLLMLTKELSEIGYKSAYDKEFINAKEQWNREMERLFNIEYNEEFKPEVKDGLTEKLHEYKETLGTTLTQTKVLGELQKHIEKNSVVVGSSGSLPGCMQRIWNPKEVGTYHMEYGYSCMGYEICGALGVKIAEPDKEVYAMTGDGSFLMLHSELITSLQMGIKINVVLLDNSGFGCINNLQMGNGMGSFGTEFREGNDPNGQVMNIDYKKVAEGYGAISYKITTYEELEKAIKDAKNQTKSVLFDIKVLPKTMTDGYESWWNIGVAEVAKKPEILEAHKRKMEGFAKARKY